MQENGYTRFRGPAGRGAGRRPAIPDVRASRRSAVQRFRCRAPCGRVAIRGFGVLRAACRPPAGGELAGGRRSKRAVPCLSVGTALKGSAMLGFRVFPFRCAVAQRCRPPPGELARGRRSLACRTIALSGGTWFAALRAAVRAPTGRTGRRSAFQAVPALFRNRQCVVSRSSRLAYKGRTPRPDGPGVPV